MQFDSIDLLTLSMILPLISLKVISFKGLLNDQINSQSEFYLEGKRDKLFM
jgi:hypothetical protein